jgi:hypothetical protein
MDEHHRMLAAAAAICIHQLLVSYFIIFDDVPTASEAHAAKRRKRELTSYKRNLSVEYGRLTTNLEHIPHLERILQDKNRPYMKDVTHGTRPANNIHSKCKLDHFHHLYYCLKWLNDGNFYRTREADIGYGKSSIHEDTVHVLQAIVEDLEDELQWPDAEKRQELAAVFPGMFHGCIGVADVKEYQVVKYLDPVKERRSWSGKKKINSYKLLSVMDHSGRYIFARLCLGKNDR